MIKKIKVKKTYKGLVELRDYDVKEFIEKNITVEVEYADDVMTLSPVQLENNIMRTSNLFPSKVGGKAYKLYGYNWEPDNN